MADIDVILVDGANVNKALLRAYLAALETPILLTEIFKTETGSLTVDQCKGTIVSNYGMTDADCTIALPAAAAGYNFIVMLPAVRARFFKLQAAAGDKIILDGVAGSDNGLVGYASGYAAYDSLSVFTCKSADGGYDWQAVTIRGVPAAS